jgi:peptide/nickel transport system substrate-binding protein
MRQRQKQSNNAFWVLGLCLASGVAVVGAEEEIWQKVQQILSSTKDSIVLDGLEKAALRSGDEGELEHGDWMVQHFLSDPENLNPFTHRDASSSGLLGYIHEGLLYADNEPPYTLKGQLAKRYPTISDDKLSYTFELRRNVHFSDGQPMTAADVLFSMKVIKHPGVQAPQVRSGYTMVKEVRVEGDYKVTFVCDEPYFRNDITLGLYFRVVPQHFYDPDGLMESVDIQSLIDGSWEEGPYAEQVGKFAEQFNQNFNRNVLGSGPYLVADVEKDVVTQQKVVLTRDANYWGTKVEGISAAGHVDKILFKIINNLDAAFIELKNGNLDMHSMQPLEFKEKSWGADFNERFLKGIRYASGYIFIGWNNEHPIFRDKRVRQAMTHLTPRQSMVENLLFGLGEPVESPIHKFRPEYNQDLPAYDYDVDRALDLLEEAGWDDTDGDGILDKVIDGEKTPFKFEFTVNSGNQIRKDIALVLQNELQDIGIVCEVRELDWSIFLDRVTKKRDFAAITLGWSGGGGVAFPPDGFSVWHSSQIEGGGFNFIGFRNSEVDQILEDYRREFDLKKRVKLYQRYQEILHEQQPYTFLWKSRGVTAYSRRFRGVNWYPGGPVPQEWWVAMADRLYH